MSSSCAVSSIWTEASGTSRQGAISLGLLASTSTTSDALMRLLWSCTQHWRNSTSLERNRDILIFKILAKHILFNLSTVFIKYVFIFLLVKYDCKKHLQIWFDALGNSERVATLNKLEDLAVAHALEGEAAEGDNFVQQDAIRPNVREWSEDSKSKTLRRHPAYWQHS